MSIFGKRLGPGRILLRGAIGEVQMLGHAAAGRIARQAKLLPGFYRSVALHAISKTAKVVIRDDIAVVPFDQHCVARRPSASGKCDDTFSGRVHRLRRATGREVEAIVHVRFLVGRAEVARAAAAEFAETPGNNFLVGRRYHASVGNGAVGVNRQPQGSHASQDRSVHTLRSVTSHSASRFAWRHPRRLGWCGLVRPLQ
ncbi:hypothetical protein D3C76_431390 [compost metagenome]